MPFHSVTFSTDGHTLAIGASGMGMILIYDLRKSSKEVHKVCSGHKNTINSIQFANKLSSGGGSKSRQQKESEKKAES